MNYKNHTECRICNSTNLIPYLDLGNLPLTNNLCDTEEENAELYPLVVTLCTDCGLSQLSIVVEPKILFGNYVYRSSISQGYKDHCYQMAISLKQQYGLDKKSFHIDIAGNDGALLNEFRKVINGRMLNVDPATNLVKINDEQNIRIYNTFWGMNAAIHLRNTYWPKADLITATNVFAHVDNIKEFLEAAKMALSDTGVLILEFPYLINFIKNNEFDTVYQEHLSYMMVTPLKRLCESIGLTIMSVEEFEIHGGSIRVHIGTGKQEPIVQKFLENEKLYLDIEPYRTFARISKLTIMDFKEGINHLIEKGYHIAAFAASAKGNTLLNCAKLTNNEIKYIIDETPEKIGKFSPGTHIPIVDMSALNIFKPDYIVILSWNFTKEIITKLKSIGYTGKFIIPIPEFEILN